MPPAFDSSPLVARAGSPAFTRMCWHRRADSRARMFHQRAGIWRGGLRPGSGAAEGANGSRCWRGEQARAGCKTTAKRTRSPPVQRAPPVARPKDVWQGSSLHRIGGGMVKHAGRGPGASMNSCEADRQCRPLSVSPPAWMRTLSAPAPAWAKQGRVSAAAGKPLPLRPGAAGGRRTGGRTFLRTDGPFRNSR